MTTLYLDRSGSELALQGDSLVVRHRDGRQRLPLALLERLVICATTHCTSSILTRLAESGIAVAFIDTRRCRRRAQLLGQGHNDVFVRLAQYRGYHDGEQRLRIARELVRAKLRRQCRWLASLPVDATLRPLQRDTRCQLENLQDSLDNTADLSQLRGMEGSAGRCFFRLYRRLFPPALGFEGRRRRPPPDPVNACLSLGYTLLHIRSVQTAWAAGLDPMIGFYHEPAWGRESLACDLIEPWRPCIDA